MIYDDVENGGEGGNSSLEYGWSSSEFESYEEPSDSEGKNGIPRSFLRSNHKKQVCAWSVWWTSVLLLPWEHVWETCLESHTSGVLESVGYQRSSLLSVSTEGSGCHTLLKPLLQYEAGSPSKIEEGGKSHACWHKCNPSTWEVESQRLSGVHCPPAVWYQDSGGHRERPPSPPSHKGKVREGKKNISNLMQSSSRSPSAQSELAGPFRRSRPSSALLCLALPVTD